ncbi:MAG: response regulator [Chloroflexota bacterium]|nr:response regulator [Chloroflexota bacterium]
MDKTPIDAPALLVVDDDVDLCDMLTEFFQQRSYVVHTAAWGDDALKIAADEPLNLIIIDIHLPDINGYDLCRMFRANRRTADTPIIFLTERRERDDKLHGLELGVVDYVTKPFDVEELLLRARNAIHRATQAPPVHPITDLPDRSALDERLAALLTVNEAWSALLVTISGLDKLREMSGFVAADEVLRAVALILRQATREGDFLAHLDAEALVLLTQPDRLAAVKSKVVTRLNMSIDHFYHADHTTDGDSEVLKFAIGALNAPTMRYPNTDALIRALTDAAEPLAT